MRARLERGLRELGVPGIVGLGLLVACAGFYATAVLPLEQAAGAQRLALERSPATRQPAADPREQELRRFYALFPTPAQLTDEAERVHALARRAGLELAQAEYRLERRNDGLWAYQVTLPVRGTYPQLRGFLSRLLSELPIASVDALRFERRKAADAQLQAQVRLTLHAQPPGDAP